jgi:hypothetical protein
VRPISYPGSLFRTVKTRRWVSAFWRIGCSRAALQSGRALLPRGRRMKIFAFSSRARRAVGYVEPAEVRLHSIRNGSYGGGRSSSVKQAEGAEKKGRRYQRHIFPGLLGAGAPKGIWLF